MGKIYLNSRLYAGGTDMRETFTLSATLSAGASSLTFSDSRIETTSRVFPWASTWGVVPDSVAVASGSVTIVFPTQSSDMNVDVDISGAYPYAEGASF